MSLVINNISTALALSFLFLIAVAGCENEQAGQSEGKQKKVPKLMFHLPKTTPPAVARLRELFDIAVGEDKLPEPISYRVLEVIHGTGVAAHSHYYLDESKDGSAKQEIDDHGHETTGEVTHTITVDMFDELADLARRLPNIAIVGDMEEETWIKLKKASSGLSEQLELAFESLESDEEKRNAIRTHAEKISESISQLEELVSATEKSSTQE